MPTTTYTRPTRSTAMQNNPHTKVLAHVCALRLPVDEDVDVQPLLDADRQRDLLVDLALVGRAVEGAWRGGFVRGWGEAEAGVGGGRGLCGWAGGGGYGGEL
jgi:hypothetical protein